ncbi:MAG: lactate racemase domain-containing protein [Cyanobacteria bacterium J06592_8]
MKKIALEVSPILSKEDILTRLLSYLSQFDFNQKRVLILCEDVTRATPINHFFPDFLRVIQTEASQVTVLFALGTHRSMTPVEMQRKLGISPETANTIKLINHNAFDDQFLRDVGKIDDIPIKINPAIDEHDIVIALGSILPHRVVGFSGGAKYLCPGIANKAAIDYTHWKITQYSESEIIGKIDNPIRQIIHQIADLVMRTFPKIYVSVNFITFPSGIAHVFIGDFYSAYQEAAEVCAKYFVKSVEPCASMLTYLDDKCVDFWQGAKAIYNCGSRIQEGGKLVICGQLPEKISGTHGEIIKRFGYSNADRIQHLVDSGQLTSPVVASHLMRVSQALQKYRVILSSENISPAECEALNLEYLNPDHIDESEFDYVVHNATDLILTAL